MIVDLNTILFLSVELQYLRSYSLRKKAIETINLLKKQIQIYGDVYGCKTSSY